MPSQIAPGVCIAFMIVRIMVLMLTNPYYLPHSALMPITGSRVIASASKKQKDLRLNFATIVPGSRVYEAHEQEPQPNDRNHEFSKNVIDWLCEPLNNMTKEMVDHVLTYDELIINHVVVLIDDTYVDDDPTNCIGIKRVLEQLGEDAHIHFKDGKGKLTKVSHIRNLRDNKVITITSTVSFVKVKSLIYNENIKKIITILKKKIPDIFIKVMTCAPGITEPLYECYYNNPDVSTHIIITKPECFHNDRTDVQFLTYTSEKGIHMLSNLEWSNNAVIKLKKDIDASTCMFSIHTLRALNMLFTRNLDMVIIIISKLLSYFSINQLFQEMTYQEFIDLYNDKTCTSDVVKKFKFNPSTSDTWIEYIKTQVNSYYHVELMHFLKSLTENNTILNAIAYETTAILEKQFVKVLFDIIDKLFINYSTYITGINYVKCGDVITSDSIRIVKNVLTRFLDDHNIQL